MIVHFEVTSPPHIHHQFDLAEDLLSFPWNYGVAYGHVLHASSCVSKWRAGLGVVFRFEVDATSPWRRTRIARSADSSWSRSPSSLILLHFLELSHLGDFVASRPYFWWWTWNHMWRLLRDWRHLHLRMVFNSRCWTLSLVARSGLSIAS